MRGNSKEIVKSNCQPHHKSQPRRVFPEGERFLEVPFQLGWVGRFDISQGQQANPPCRQCTASVFLGLTNTCCNRNGPARIRGPETQRGPWLAGLPAVIIMFSQEATKLLISFCVT